MSFREQFVQPRGSQAGFKRSVFLEFEGSMGVTWGAYDRLWRLVGKLILWNAVLTGLVAYLWWRHG